jgi:hypothetical protein
MVTGFIISPGYAPSDREKATPEIIQNIAKSITTKAFKDKCIEYGLKDDFGRGQGCQLDDFINRYKSLPTKEDMTCNFIDIGIMQSATGGSGHRNERETICRAFSILVVDECFKRGLSVCLDIS